MRTCFSTLGNPTVAGTVHSPGSNVKPYLAKRARAFSSWIVWFSLAVMAPLVLLAAGMGLFSLMIWEMPAGTDRVGVVSALVTAGAVTGGLYLS